MNKGFVLILLILSLSLACRQDTIQSIPSDNFEKFSKLIETNAVIVIRNELGTKLQGVYMTLENKTYVSDANGLILINKVALKNTGTLVYLTHPNYFRTPKRIYPTSSVINLAILSKNPAKKFLSNTDSQIEFDQVKYEFDANTIADEKGNLYTGEVFIYSSIISLMDPLFGLIMPSDFRAYNKNGKSVLVNSLGIVATELFSSSGDRLNLVTDASAKITLKIEPGISNPPSSISSWSISEAKHTAVWREEELAILKDQEYSFYVNHFSYWNLGEANPFVSLRGKVYKEEK